MKRFNRQTPVVATIGAWWLSNIILHAKAFHYGCAAYREEQNGFPIHGGDGVAQGGRTVITEHASGRVLRRQWERIMRLPRRLARPVGVSQQCCYPHESGFSSWA